MSPVSTGRPSFVERHAAWTEEQWAAAERLQHDSSEVEFVRVGFCDPHGILRSKVLTASAFRNALGSGLDMSPGPFVFDTGHALPNDIFEAGGGIGLTELQGGGDFVLVPDPLTYRTTHVAGVPVGIILGDEHLRDGTPHPLSSRRVLRDLLEKGAAANRYPVIGLELEFYVFRLLDPADRGSVGGFGVQGRHPAVELVNGGYQFNSDLLITDLLPVLDPACSMLRDELMLPLRSIEHESGPGQIEMTFAPMDALSAADAILLARANVKRALLQQGYLSSFMAAPGLPGVDPSGWHLHQSLTDADGRNLFASSEGELLSPLGTSYVAGLLAHGRAATALAIPTVNGYRRLAPENVLSPDRLVWSHENRGAFVRVVGEPGDRSSHVENRIGEPAANPYLYIASQCAAGLDGIERAEVRPAAAHPHDPEAEPVPADLSSALESLRASRFFRNLTGDFFLDNLLALKFSEWNRYVTWRDGQSANGAGGTSSWENDEYMMMF
jgi:glutamine synthetase